VVEQKNIFEKIETLHLMLSRRGEGFHNEKRSDQRASAEFGCGWFDRDLHAIAD
jgi:hypothetical protein